MSCTEDHSRYIRAFIARDAAFKEAHPRPGVGTWRFGPWLFAKGQYLSQGTLEPGWEFPDAAEVGQDPTPPTEATEHVQKWGVTPHPEYIQTSTVEAVRGVTPEDQWETGGPTWQDRIGGPPRSALHRSREKDCAACRGGSWFTDQTNTRHVTIRHGPAMGQVHRTFTTCSGVTPQARDNTDRSGVAVPLDLDRVRQLQAEGKGWRAIAAELEKETGVVVSFMTIKRRLERATKALV